MTVYGNPGWRGRTSSFQPFLRWGRGGTSGVVAGGAGGQWPPSDKFLGALKFVILM